jgi:hypothetical protein
VRLTPDFQGRTHKIGAVSPHGEISGTLPEGFLTLRVVSHAASFSQVGRRFPGLRVVFLNCALLSGSTFVFY